MQSSDRNRGLDAARAMEKRGQLEAACQAYARLGAVEDAARVLSSLRRFADAARMLLSHVGVEPATASGLEGEQRRLALKAGIYLTRAGASDDAVELFLALGEPQRAAEVLERAGDSVRAAQILRKGKRTPSGRWRVGTPETTAQKLEAAGQNEAAIQAFIREGRPAEAARVARGMGRHEDAAELFGDAGLPYEAARSFLQAGLRRRALGMIVRVPRDAAAYRAAAREAIRLASELDSVEIHFEHFVGDFIGRGPGDRQELDAFYELGRLYERRGFIENAEEVYRKIVDRDAGFRDTRQLLAGLEEARRRERQRFERSLEEDAHFWGRGTEGRVPSELPDLPDLPDLPPPPGAPPPGRTARRTRRVPPPAPQPERAEPPAAAPSAPAPPPAAPQPIPAGQNEVGDAQFEEGMTLKGRYRLEQEIGAGGMATVFRATDLELEEAIAIKVFRTPFTDDDSLARFRQEIKLSRKLQQPNVTRVYDLGEHAGHRYLTMELLVGESLESRLRRPLRLDEAIGYLIQACAGLQAAHDLGIIHRDIKPDNLFITDGGIVKVMDFGIAKQQAAPGFTVMGTIAGTPEYMSPEQVNNFTSVTPSTDLYALGVIAFRMCTGRLPFVHEELVPLLMMQVQEPPPKPRLLNPDLPAALEAVVLKALEKDPGRRFPTCRDMAGELKTIAASL